MIAVVISVAVWTLLIAVAAYTIGHADGRLAEREQCNFERMDRVIARLRR